MDRSNQQPRGDRKIKLRIHLEFLIRSDSDILSLQSNLAVLPLSGMVERKDEPSEPQNPLDLLTNHFRQMRLSTPDEAGADEKRGEDARGDLNAIWAIEVDEEVIRLGDSPWRLARVRSPFTHLTSQLTSTLASVCAAIRITQGLTIGLNHLPRLRIEIKPEAAEFTIINVRRTLLFLWHASPRLDTLHAEYCGPSSATAPGLEFSRLFNVLPRVYPAFTTREGSVATKSAHGPPEKIDMLSTASVRGTRFEQAKVRAVGASDDMDWLTEGTNVHVWDYRREDRIVPGAYDFSSLLKPNGGFIRFNQHAGTLDPEAIDNWIRVCCGIVDFCLNAPGDQWQCIQMRLKLPSKPNSSARGSGSGVYNVFDLLVNLELPSQATYYRSLGPNPFVSEFVPRRRTPVVNMGEMRGVSPYTFGIELEFLVPYCLVGAPDPHRNDPRWVYRHRPSPLASGKSTSKDDENDDDERLPASKAVPHAVDPHETETLDTHVYAANADHLVNLLKQAGHLSAAFNTLANPMDPSDATIPADALETILAEAGDPSLYFLEGLDPRHQLWHVHRDPSLSSFHHGEAGYAGHLGIEISSPVLRDCPEDFEKIFDVLKVIRSGARPMLDPSCGFHVHVGHIRGFSLRGLKKIATLVWAAELVLYSLVHPSRENNEMTVPVSKGSTLACTEELPEYNTGFDLENPDTNDAQMEAKRLSLEIEAHVPMETLPQRLQDEILQIWSASSEYGIVRLLQPDGGCKGGVSFLSVHNSMNNQPTVEGASYEGTVKFRLLEGTLDPELITYWTKLVLRIVERGMSTEPVEYFRMMETILKDYYSVSARLAGFFGALGLQDHYTFWAKIARRNKGLAETGHGASGEQWQHSVCKKQNLTEADKEACMRRWYEQNITRVPAVDDNTLGRARNIL